MNRKTNFWVKIKYLHYMFFLKFEVPCHYICIYTIIIPKHLSPSSITFLYFISFSYSDMTSWRRRLRIFIKRNSISLANGRFIILFFFARLLYLNDWVIWTVYKLHTMCHRYAIKKLQYYIVVFSSILCHTAIHKVYIFSNYSLPIPFFSPVPNRWIRWKTCVQYVQYKYTYSSG